MDRKETEKPDLREKGGLKDGQPQALDRRLFMQLLGFGSSTSSQILIEALKRDDFPGVLYEDLTDPRGVAVLSFSEEPDFFVGRLRSLLNSHPFDSLATKPEYTMTGRTYSLGYEPDLADTLIDRPCRTVLNPDWPWAIWYPLRRKGAFTQLAPEEQRAILKEHGTLGLAFGQADYAHDVRLACHGLDKNDNDFVIGLIGRELYPLSAIVQRMRKTQQTSLYLEQLGPFFIGKAVWQSPGK